jgi:mRNA interferase RelE/StbE
MVAASQARSVTSNKACNQFDAVSSGPKTKTIIWTHSATAQFLDLPEQVQDRIEEKLSQYAVNPTALANQVKKLEGVVALRLRVADYRVIFTDEGLILMILKVGHRKEIYD